MAKDCRRFAISL